MNKLIFILILAILLLSFPGQTAINTYTYSKFNKKVNKQAPQEKINFEVIKKANEININFKKYYKVVKVVDGDTIDVNIDNKIERIRLIGINTPESVDPRRPVECLGIEASNKAKELLSDKEVYLESDSSQDDRDKYGRLLRYVWTKEGLFYNLEIIKLGFAYEYTYIVPYKFQEEFKKAEETARTNKIGLWSDGACN